LVGIYARTRGCGITRKRVQNPSGPADRRRW
jgi:hypothetical protein